ncbi:hypothetical protein DERF_004114 [Dermatophagoides farinae]|uniref:Uncharacterized protein n=1 Tax=Dermatophagoides farinae TaxID=6954 RepID=A0A922IG86_DERFA|nr:hypothetical protein DERF_004114 [Dermatophagoides farinae]
MYFGVIYGDCILLKSLTTLLDRPPSTSEPIDVDDDDFCGDIRFAGDGDLPIGCGDCGDELFFSTTTTPRCSVVGRRRLFLPVALAAPYDLLRRKRKQIMMTTIEMIIIIDDTKMVEMNIIHRFN